MSVNQAGGPLRIHQIHKLPAPYSDFFFQALEEIIPTLTSTSITCGGGVGGVRGNRNLAWAT